MEITNAVALVTGANRGIGKQLAEALLDAGASKVYAGVRDPASVTDPRLVPVQLDVTDETQVKAAAAELDDVTIVINNAGIGEPGKLFGEGALDAARREIEVNYLGTLGVSLAFAPVLKANGGGALLNILSVASWVGSPALTTYAASKSAQWSVTNALRVLLREQGTLVTGLHVGFVDTDLTAGLDVPKTAPETVAEAAVNGIASGAEEVIVDDFSRSVKAGLSDDINSLYPLIQADYDATLAATR
jgi:NAD(P)-dependent dehydrogenase (short-subunit alcohol dehydrogenase family)